MSKSESLLDTALMLVVVIFCVWSCTMAIRQHCIYLLPAIVFLFGFMVHLFLIIKQGKARD